jgi:hypothetical protein
VVEVVDSMRRVPGVVDRMRHVVDVVEVLEAMRRGLEVVDGMRHVVEVVEGIRCECWWCVVDLVEGMLCV